MQNHFFAVLSRMKNIYRWGLMRNTKQENLSEHSLEVAFIAHALCIIENEKFGKHLNADYAATVAMYHDTTEILTGDMPTPIKYFNPEINTVYKQIEGIAANKLISMLPEYMRKSFTPIYFCEDEEINKIVKAADKISAYIKCTEEIKMGNGEFSVAEKSIKKAIDEMRLPSVKVFMEDFMPSYKLSIDEQQ